MVRLPSFREQWLPLPFLGLLVLHLFFPLGAIAVGARIMLFLVLAWMGGRTLLPTHDRFVRIVLGAFGVGALLSIGLTTAYYASVLITSQTIVLVETLATAIVLFLAYLFPFSDPEEEPSPPSRSWILWILGSIAIGTTIALLFTLHASAITASIRTPWALLPHGTFLLFGVLLLCAYTASLLRTSSPLSALLPALPAFSLASIPVLLYPFGYGFDGFIHRASQSLLFATGTITPKPLYYIGQYVWTMWLTRAIDLPLKTVDLWLVPVLLGLFLWIAGSWSRRTHPFFAPLLLLTLPLGSLLVTTPQTTAYLLGSIALLLSLWIDMRSRGSIIPLLLALWAVACHPLGGLPFACVLFARWMASFVSRAWLRHIVSALGVVGAIASIPLAFAVQSLQTSTPIAWSWEWVSHIRFELLLASLGALPRQTLLVWIDATGWVEIGLRVLMLLGGALLLFRSKHHADRMLAATGLGLWFVQIILEQSAVFSFLIAYERQNYTQRLGVLSLLFLAIPLSRWISDALVLLAKRSGMLFTIMLCALLGATSVHLYNALPRHDAGQASSGWSAGKADVEAVEWIHEQARDVPYTVLANQSVSAIALERFGFFRYAKNNVFYYPLPTGDTLYQLFLKIATPNASREDIEKARALTESERVYVVLNRYWWDADRVHEHLSSFADRTLSFQDAVWVFEFDRPSANTASQ